MWESIANTLVLGTGVYLGIGLIFGLFFVTLGVQRIDAAAKGGSWGFRCLILPGSAAFWPLLLVRWMRSGATPPEQQDAHRSVAKNRAQGR